MNSATISFQSIYCNNSVQLKGNTSRPIKIVIIIPDHYGDTYFGCNFFKLQLVQYVDTTIYDLRVSSTVNGQDFFQHILFRVGENGYRFLEVSSSPKVFRANRWTIRELIGRTSDLLFSIFSFYPLVSTICVGR